MQDWSKRAKCLGMPAEMFFPNCDDPIAAMMVQEDAKAICAQCEVKQQCLEFALSFKMKSDEWGVFGGTTPKERKVIRRERRK